LLLLAFVPSFAGWRRDSARHAKLNCPIVITRILNALHNLQTPDPNPSRGTLRGVVDPARRAGKRLATLWGRASTPPATAWRDKAARRQSAPTQFSLGLRYRYRKEGAKEKLLTYAWMRNSAAQGDIIAVEALKQLENRISEEDASEQKDLSLTPDGASRPVLTHSV